MRKDKSVALGLFGIAVLYSIGCVGLKLGTLRKPGPGLYPSLIAVALLLCTVVHTYKVFTGKAETSSPPEGTQAVNLRAWVGIAICVLPTRPCS
jgi:hypothetical protein